MRHSIQDPISELEAAREALSLAADAHLSGDHAFADAALRRANCPIVWSWLNPAWIDVDRHVVNLRPEADTQPVPKCDRDPDRNIRVAVRKSVLLRDGFSCRYCGISVISSDIRKFFAKHYPPAVPWHPHDPSKQHAGFQSLWLQFDHVVPHSHGGRSDPENIVVSCALCNFGKYWFTLRQLGLSDPRLRLPVPNTWDGLERLRPILKVLPISHDAPSSDQQAAAIAICDTAPKASNHAAGREGVQAFFIPGARMSKGYLVTPSIDGKERWFALTDDVRADQVTRNGVQGYRLVCSPSHLRRRGIKVGPLLDVGQ